MEATPALRVATLEDANAIEALMKASIRDIFPAFYDARQSTAGVEHIAHVDTSLLEDGTYFVIETGGELVACGGWSRRDRLYTGSGDAAGDARLLDPATEAARVRAMFTRTDWTRRGLGRRILDACEAAALAEGFTTLALMATLPGVLLYERFGFEKVEDTTVVTPDGTVLAAVSMRMSIPREIAVDPP